MNLSIQDIEYFLAVVDHGQLSRAAQLCGISQPALSKSLRRLEEETGLRLIERSTRSMTLTSAGLVFVEHARRLKAEYGDAVEHARQLKIGQAGLLRIGATGATLDACVIPALTVLLPKRPALRVALTIDLSDSLYDRIEHGDLDIAVAPTFSSQSPRLEQISMGQDLLRIVARNTHPVRYRPTLEPADLTAYPWILPKQRSIARARLDTWFEEANLTPPKAALETDFISEGCLNLIAATDMLALVPTSFIDRCRPENVGILPLTMGLSREISLLTRKDSIWTPLKNEFRVVLESVMHAG